MYRIYADTTHKNICHILNRDSVIIWVSKNCIMTIGHKLSLESLKILRDNNFIAPNITYWNYYKLK